MLEKNQYPVKSLTEAVASRRATHDADTQWWVHDDNVDELVEDTTKVARTKKKKRRWLSLDTGEKTTDEQWVKKSLPTPEHRVKLNSSVDTETEGNTDPETWRVGVAKVLYIVSVIGFAIGVISMATSVIISQIVQGGFYVSLSTPLWWAIVGVCLVVWLLVWLIIRPGKHFKNRYAWRYVFGSFIVTLLLLVCVGGLFIVASNP